MHRPSTSLIALVLAAASGSALANVGVPVVMNTAFGMLLALIPVCVIEALVLQKVTGCSLKATAFSSLLANLASTAAGLLVALVDIGADEALGGALGFVSMGVIPPRATTGTMTDLAHLILLVPCLFLSVIIETPVHRVRLGKIDPVTLRRAVWSANLASYLMLAMFLLARMAKSAYVHGHWLVEFNY
jgi:hypothetical protein